jgi:hypothetical protein
LAAAEAHDVQVFDKNETKLQHQTSGEFVLEVSPLFCAFCVELSDLSGQLSIPFAASPAAGAFALEKGQPLLSLSKPTRVLYLLPCGEGGEVLQPHIQAYIWLAIREELLERQLDLKDDIPVKKPVPLEDRHLDLAIIRDRPMLEDADEPYILDIKPIVLEFESVSVDIADGLEVAYPLPPASGGTGVDSRVSHLP